MLGYHGTTASDAECILRDGFRASSGFRQWLGEGIYFFEGSLGWARWWTETRGLNPPGVLEATITVDRSAIFDLLDFDDLTRFEALRKSVLTTMRKEGKGFRPPHDKSRDGLILELICQAEPKIKVIRGAFAPPDDTKPWPIKTRESRIDRIHIQLCCRDKGLIMNIRRVV